MTSLIGTVAAGDGTILRTRYWQSTRGDAEPIGAVLIVHGLAEHSGRWEHVGEQLAAEGLDTYSFDLRGHGASAGRRVHLDAFDEFYVDLAERLGDVRARASGRPVILYGHSLGGLIALGYVLRVATAAAGSGSAGTGSAGSGSAGSRSTGSPVGRRPLPDLLVLSAPGLDSTIPAWKTQLARVLGRIAPTLSIPNHLGGELLSRDLRVGERYHGDPLVLHAATARFGAAALAEQAWVRSSVRALTIPTLVIHGDDDALVPARASAALEAVPGVLRRTYPGIRHELHNEPEGPGIVADVIAWIEGAIHASA